MSLSSGKVQEDLTEIKGLLIEIRTRQDLDSRMLADHELRLRTLTEWRNQMVGRFTVVGAFVSFVFGILGAFICAMFKTKNPCA